MRNLQSNQMEFPCLTGEAKSQIGAPNSTNALWSSGSSEVNKILLTRTIHINQMIETFALHYYFWDSMNNNLDVNHQIKQQYLSASNC